MNSNNKKAIYSLLFDYYESLLTEKQRLIFIGYFINDFSLAEIAEDLNISRNAVFDTIKTTQNLLDSYEKKLKLFEKNQKLNKYLDELKNHTDETGKKIIHQIEEME